jgi:hypothetical protein
MNLIPSLIYGSCGNLKDHTVYNNIDVRPQNMVVHQILLGVKSNYLKVELIVLQQTNL